MKDWLFFPLIGLVAVVIVTFALTRGDGVSEASVDDILRDGYTLMGDDLATLTASPGTTFDLVGDLAVLRATTPQALAPPSAGIFATLGPQYERAFGGREIEITFDLRRPPDGPETVRLGYFTAGAGDSGWRDITLSDDFRAESFVFTPSTPAAPAFDLVGIWPEETGQGRPVELRAIFVTVR